MNKSKFWCDSEKVDVLLLTALTDSAWFYFCMFVGAELSVSRFIADLMYLL